MNEYAQNKGESGLIFDLKFAHLFKFTSEMKVSQYKTLDQRCKGKESENDSSLYKIYR